MTTRPASIQRLDWAPVDLRLSIPTPPGAAPITARNLLVRVRLADGTVGYGEAAPYPGATAETLPSTAGALSRIAARVHRRDAGDWSALCRELAAELPAAPAARCGAVQAIADAAARRCGLPLARYLGGEPHPLLTDITVVPGDAAHAAAAAAAAAAAGFTRIKVKLAGAWRADAERVAAVAAAAPAAVLRAEGNGRYDLDGAGRLVDALHRAGIELELFEQPTPPRRYRDLVRLERTTGVAVCADESVRTVDDLRRLADAGGVHAVNVKPMLWGVTGALDLIRAAADAGIACLAGGMVETVVSTSFTAALAAVHRDAVPYADLDGPWFVSGPPVTGGIRYTAGRVEIPAAAGTGIDASAAFDQP